MSNFVQVATYAIQGINDTLFIIFKSLDVETQKKNCTKLFQNGDTYFVGKSSSLLIAIAVLMFNTKRVSFKTNTCNGRPGLAIPMDMLKNNENIYEYILAFLSLSEDIYQAIFGWKYWTPSMSPLEKFLIKLAIVIYYSILSYPIFTGIYKKHLMGYTISFIYAVVFMIFGILDNYSGVNCLIGTIIIPKVIIYIVCTIIDGSLVVIFLWKIFHHIKVNGFRNTEKSCYIHCIDEDSRKYVVRLLKKNVENKTKDRTFFEKINFNQINKEITQRVYVKISGFRIPPLLAIGISVGLYFAYRIFMDQIIDLTPQGWNVIYLINKGISKTNTNMKTAFQIVSGNYSHYSDVKIINAFSYLALFYTNLFLGCVIAAIIVGLLNSVIQSFLILRNYRLHFQKISKKGFSSIIALRKAPDCAGLVSGLVRYSGYQAAYLLWGITVVIIFMFLFLFISIGIILLPLIFLENSWIRQIFMQSLPVIIGSYIVVVIQSLLVRFIFVRERGKLMEINNRRAFMIYAHCAFFLNVMMGIFNSIKRMIIWMLNFVFCFSRIDFSALPIYLQTLDSGYMSYIGFLYTFQYHQNPIMKCFIDILVENFKRKRSISTKSDITINYENAISKKYRIKWQVALTLINNCQLQTNRKKLNVKLITEKCL